MADDHKTIYEMVKKDRIYNEEFLEKAKTSPHQEEVPEILKDIEKEQYKRPLATFVRMPQIEWNKIFLDVKPLQK